ncbi:ABC transporter ATP-binding protein [Acrocarpospora pleiomorpha]|uniref:ABC transporter ATP-binding protein n=1 Tax=Acrocarpospora pleiomorpha TaxID=90975 RepID=A0A5M3XGR7_9ACTN|nr:ABC transporter ATP-binding protein [Acrocarpospora pleiomorpha]GES17268.1 ABC transporter ATP-binding protein [Acrocarpospora pleiomorpha]
MTELYLRVENLVSGYGDLTVLRDVALSASPGKITVVLGANGAGKTTLLSTITGVVKAQAGTIELLGQDVTRTPTHLRVRQGLALVQEGKRVFRQRTVEENLALGGRHLGRRDRAAAIEVAYRRFPVLKDKSRQKAALLSGGQQQMLAIAQALVPEPEVLMLDEPSAGLAPVIVKELLATVRTLRDEGKAVVLVEQLVGEALSVADQVLVLNRGHVVIDEPASAVTEDDVRAIYLGVGAMTT